MIKRCRAGNRRPSEKAVKRVIKNAIEVELLKIDEVEARATALELIMDKLNNDERNRFNLELTKIIAVAVRRVVIKLSRDLTSDTQKNTFPVSPERVIFNFTNITLSKHQTEALSLGPKFCIVNKNRSDKDKIVMQADLECFYEDLTRNVNKQHYDESAVKAEIRSAYEQYSKSFKENRLLTKKHYEAVKELQKNKNIRLMKPDKGSGVVLMQTSDYVHGMQTIISDPTKFQKDVSQKDGSLKADTQITSLLNKTIRRLDDIAKTVKTNENRDDPALTTWLKELDKAKPVGSTPPRLYGLPKIHKISDEVTTPPLRPVLSMINSPQHAPARLLCRLLQPIKEHINQHTVKDTHEFVHKIKDINILDGKMISLDVQSLFTNVPLRKTIDVLCSLVESVMPDFMMTMQELKDLLYACTQNVQFLFQGEYYRQVDGISMGSPLGSLLADVYMFHLETTVLKSTIESAIMYIRYVDDIFLIIPKHANASAILIGVNQVDDNIKFTLEEEIERELPFLDVLMKWEEDGSIRRSIYRKTSYTGQYLHFQSSVPRAQKRNLVSNLANRIRKICSPCMLQTELDSLKEFLILNGYPEKFIDLNIKPKLDNQEEPGEANDTKKAVLSIQFAGDLPAEILKRRILRVTKTQFPSTKIITVFRTQRLLLINEKDRLPFTSNSLAVYKFECTCNQQYIGRTKRRLDTRISQHLPQKLINRGATPAQITAIGDHIIASGHIANKNNFSILFKGRSIRAMNAYEALAIAHYKPSLNVQKYHTHDINLDWTYAATRNRVTNERASTTVATSERQTEPAHTNTALATTNERMHVPPCDGQPESLHNTRVTTAVTRAQPIEPVRELLPSSDQPRPRRNTGPVTRQQHRLASSNGLDL